MMRVIIESPLAGDRERNKRYARACMVDSLERGEAPFASHLLYDHPEILDDDSADDRAKGIAAGFEWGWCADLVAVYCDLGISKGMELGIERARKRGQPVEMRTLDGWK